jgi:hypothetical protein
LTTQLTECFAHKYRQPEQNIAERCARLATTYHPILVTPHRAFIALSFVKLAHGDIEKLFGRK